MPLKEGFLALRGAGKFMLNVPDLSNVAFVSPNLAAE